MNTLQELQETLSDFSKEVSDIKCLTISYEQQTFNLKIGWTEQDWNKLLNDLDFEYHEGYGGQELFDSIVWFNDGSWLERGEYDGSEWWAYKTTPLIPDNLNQI
tara:strand:+ start:1798 stop:2109 length:312 start_codon:yes stop_codon:yes gene_type:complete